MSSASPTCSVVVPVRNEAASLDRTIPALLAAARGEQARLLWVCNGCTDDSAARIRRLVGPDAEIIVLPEAGKTLALQAGDRRLGDVFPRLYLDADTWLRPGDLRRLFAPLREGRADLVTAAKAFEYGKASDLATAIARCWLALPYARQHSFLGALAVSAAGRTRWEDWPPLLADDLFLSAMIPPTRRLMVPEAVATTWPPRDLPTWIRTRARWMRGERQMRAAGFDLPVAPLQRGALLQRLAARSTRRGAAAFVLVRLLAAVLAWRTETLGWLPERQPDKRKR